MGDSERLGHTDRILYIVALGLIFCNKPETIFSLAGEEFAFYLRGITGLRPVAGELRTGRVVRGSSEGKYRRYSPQRGRDGLEREFFNSGWNVAAASD